MKTKCNNCRKTRLAILLILALGLEQRILAQPFIHPGGLHKQADFNRLAAKVAANASPWVDSYNQMTTLSLANLGWSWDPVTQIWRGAGPQNYARSQLDALAIYYLALRYQITGNTNCANYAIQGMDAWSSTMTNGVIGSGATLLRDSVSQILGLLSGSNSSSVQLAGNFSTAFTFGNTSNTVFAGSISGNGSVTKNGTGAVRLFPSGWLSPMAAFFTGWFIPNQSYLE